MAHALPEPTPSPPPATAVQLAEVFPPLCVPWGRGSHRGVQGEARVLKPSFLRKFVSYVRKRVNPTDFTEAAQARIAAIYTDLRKNARDASSAPVTARTLETIIRLSTAMAKLRLDYNRIEEDDVIVAETILRAALTRSSDEKENGDGKGGGNVSPACLDAFLPPPAR